MKSDDPPFDLVMVEGDEIGEERISSPGCVFGSAGTCWATVVEIGVASASPIDRAWGFRWRRGKLPQFLIPGVISLEVTFRVCSPGFVESDSRFLRNGQLLGVRQEAFDYDAATDWAREIVRSIGIVPRAESGDRLSEFFHVYDYDDD